MKKWLSDWIMRFKALNISKKFLIAFGISVACYLIFFYKLLSPNYFFWGSDVPSQYYPPRVYLYNSILKDHKFPFWTERLYSGFPLYSDMENAYLDVPNVVSILLFGPMWSYKILLFSEYLVGSMCIYLFLKRKGCGLVSFFITNLVFYFSFFNLNHTIHLNVMIISYLLPIHILLADLFLEKPKLKYIVLQSLVMAHGIYWGHPQFSLISAIVIILYLLIMGLKKLKFRKIRFYLVLLGLLSVIETLPLTVPAFSLYLKSPRNGEISYLQGNLPPNLALVTVYPYIFGTWKNYVDATASRLTYTETYIYIGISVAIVAVAGILTLKKNRLFWFAYSLILLFLFFAFVRYTPIGLIKHPLLIDLFRYWERIIYATALGFGMLAGMYIEKIPTTSLKKALKSSLFILLPVLYIYVLYLTNIRDERVAHVNEALQIFPLKFQTSVYFLTWKVLRGVTVALVGLTLVVSHIYKDASKRKALLALLPIAFCAVVLYDLRFNARDVLAARIFDLRTIQTQNFGNIATPAGFDNKRVIYSNIYKVVDFLGNEYLYLKSWSPFGYSQFYDLHYAARLTELGFTQYKGARIHGFKVCDDPAVRALKRLGIDFLYIDTTTTCQIPEINTLDVIKERIDGTYVTKTEGNIEMILKNPTTIPLSLTTYLRSDPDWYVVIDGKRATLDKMDTFMIFTLPVGEHNVQFKFIPYSFYKGVGLSVVSGGILILGYYLGRKKLYKFLEN